MPMGPRSVRGAGPVRRPRVRLTTGRLMAVVAAVGLASALFLTHPSLGALATGFLSLTLLRAFEKADAAREAGTPLRPAGLAGTLLTSALVAAVILVTSLVPALLILPALVRRPGLDRETVVGIAVAAAAGFPIAWFWRRNLW